MNFLNNILIGRHTGTGKREGTENARISFKMLWMRRIRIFRRLLKKYRELKKIDKHLYLLSHIKIIYIRYHSFYMKCKGNQFKNKYVLIEAIHKAKNEEKRAKDLGPQAEAKKAKKKEDEKKVPVPEGDKAKEVSKEEAKDKPKEKAPKEKKPKDKAPKETKPKEDKPKEDKPKEKKPKDKKPKDAAPAKKE